MALERQPVARRELVIAPQCRGQVLPPVEHGAQLAPAGDAEVQRGADALGGQRQAVAGRVADEEHAVLGGRAQAVRDPVALEAHRVGRHVGGQRQRRVLDVQARVERADADPQLVARRERPAVAGRDVAAVEPQLEVVAGAVRMDLQPARQRRPPAAARSHRPRAPAASRARPRSRARARRRGRCGRRCRSARPPWRSRTRRRRSGPTAGRTASGSRRSRTSTAAASGRSPEACGRAAIRRSGGSIQRARDSRSHSVGAAHAEVCRSPIS